MNQASVSAHDENDTSLTLINGSVYRFFLIAHDSVLADNITSVPVTLDLRTYSAPAVPGSQSDIFSASITNQAVSIVNRAKTNFAGRIIDKNGLIVNAVVSFGKRSCTIPLDGLEKGEYLLHITSGKDIFVMKFSVVQ